MAQQYGTIAAHTLRRVSVLVVFVVFCKHIHSFAGLIRRTPPPTFSDTAINDRHSDTSFPAQSSLGADILVYWIRKIFRTCALGGSLALDFLLARRASYPLGQALRSNDTVEVNPPYIVPSLSLRHRIYCKGRLFDLTVCLPSHQEILTKEIICYICSLTLKPNSYFQRSSHCKSEVNNIITPPFCSSCT